MPLRQDVKGLSQTTPLYLFDTNIIIEIIRQNQLIVAKIKQLQQVNATYTISSVTVGELFYGAYHSKRDVEEALQQVIAITQSTTVISCNRETGKQYGEIKELLRVKGNMIPDNDIWIAATSLQYNLTLVTRDAHFSHIEHISIEQW